MVVMYMKPWIRMNFLLVLLMVIDLNGIQGERQASWGEFMDYYSQISINNATGTSSFLVNAVLKGLDLAISEDKCFNDLRTFSHALQKKEKWALKMLDSSTHMQSGFLEGNIANYGNFEECLDIDNKDNGITGQSCIVTMFTNDIMPITIERRNIQLSLCLPSSCDSMDMHYLLRNGLQLRGTQFAVYGCDTKMNHLKPYNSTELSIIIFYTVLVAVILIATTYDVISKKCCGNTENDTDEECETLLKVPQERQSKFKGFLISFSMYSNGKDLLEVDTKNESVKPLHGLRCIAACGVLCVHRHLLDPQDFTNTFMIDDEMRKWYRMIVFNSYLWVDAFFLMSGLLISYHFLRKPEKKKRLSLWKFYLHRYLRLTPALAAVVLIAIMTSRMCDGPHCNYLSYVYSRSCEMNWWLTLTYLNNIIDQHNMCLLHAWYLAADMQMYVFSPVLLYILSRWPRLVFPQLTIFYIMAKVYIYTVAFTYNLLPSFIGTNGFFKLDSEMVYNQSYGRIGPWLLGFALGILLQRHNENPRKISKTFATIGWTMSIIFCTGAMFGIAPFIQKDNIPGPVVASLFKAFYRDIWAIGIGWIVYACYTGRGGWVNRFLSNPIFHPLSKLTYSFYLIHSIAQFFLFKTAYVPRRYSDVTQFAILIGDVHISLIFAVILYLLVEAPTINLEKLFWNRRPVINEGDEFKKIVVKEA